MSDPKSQQPSILESEDFQNKIVQYLLDNDIRVIFYGDAHNEANADTQLPVSLVQALITSDKINLKSIYFEYTGEQGKDDDAESAFFRHMIEDTYQTLNLTDEAKNLSGNNAVFNQLYSQKQLNKVFAFGRNHHAFTRETLDAAIKAVKLGEVAVITIGAGHLFQATDTQNKYWPFVKFAGDDPRQINDQPMRVQNIADATYFITSQHVNDQFILGYTPTDSLGLVDYFAAQYKETGILAINGMWRESYLARASKDQGFIEKRGFIVTNRSIRELLTRHAGSGNVHVAKNYYDWDEAYLKTLNSDAKKTSDNDNGDNENDEDDKKNDEEPNKKVNRVNARILENFKTYDGYFSDDFFASRINERNVDFNEQLLPRQKRFIGGLMNYVFSEFLPETDKYLQEKKQSDILSNLYFTSILYLTSMPENDLRMKDPTNIFLRFPPVPKDVNAPAQDKKAENQDLPNDDNEEDSKDDASLGDDNPGMNDPRLAKKLAFLGGDSESDDENDSDAAKKKSSKDKASPPPVNPATPSDPGDNDNSNGMDYIDLDSDEDD